MKDERPTASEAVQSGVMIVMYAFFIVVILFAIFGTALLGIAPIPVVPGG